MAGSPARVSPNPSSPFKLSPPTLPGSLGGLQGRPFSAQKKTDGAEGRGGLSGAAMGAVAGQLRWEVDRVPDQPPGRVLFYVAHAGVSPRPRPLWAPPLWTPCSLSAKAIKWGNSLYPKGWCGSHTSAQLEVWTQQRTAVSCLFTWDRTWSPRLWWVLQITWLSHPWPPEPRQEGCTETPLPHLPSHFCTPSG